jgi:hypothetical protein
LLRRFLLLMFKKTSDVVVVFVFVFVFVVVVVVAVAA